MKFSEMVARNERFNFKDAIVILLPIYMNAHNWNVEDSLTGVQERKRQYILKQILTQGVTTKQIVGEVVTEYAYDPDGGLIDGSDGSPVEVVVQAKSYVEIKSLIKYVVTDIKDESIIPDELKELAGISAFSSAGTEILKPKYDRKIDKLVCQGIARTLWDIEPDMTLKAMSNHRAIQEYGNGSHYKDPKTLPGWLSEVDPRPEDKRRGKKKKSTTEGDIEITP